MRSRNIIAIFLITPLAATTIANVASPSDLNTATLVLNGDLPSAEGSPERSTAFRRDIEQIYRLNYAQPPSTASAELTKLTTRYIPVGSKFGEAEVFLRAAGFIVNTDNGHFPPDPKRHRAYVSAILNIETRGAIFKNSGCLLYTSPSPRD